MGEWGGGEGEGMTHAVYLPFPTSSFRCNLSPCHLSSLAQAACLTFSTPRPPPGASRPRARLQSAAGCAEGRGPGGTRVSPIRTRPYRSRCTASPAPASSSAALQRRGGAGVWRQDVQRTQV